MKKKLKIYILLALLIGVTGYAKVSEALIRNPVTSSAGITTSSLILSGFTEGSVLFATSTGLVTQDNSGLFFNSDSNRLGINTSNPLAELHVVNGGSGGIRLQGTGTTLTWERSTGEDLMVWGTSSNSPTISINRLDGTTRQFRFDANSRFLSLENGSQLGIETTAPTHAITVASVATSGIALYNTADQTTNYERGTLAWTSNTLQLDTTAAGSGTPRQLTLRSTGSSARELRIFSTTNTTAQFDFVTTGAVATANGVFAAVRGNSTASSGIFQNLALTPTINQSGTAGYSILNIQPTETATGSGSKLLIQAGTAATTTLWALDNNGHHVTGGKTPVLSSCGSGPSISGTDHAGTVTGGTGSTGCTITFGTAYTTAPHCSVTPRTGSIVNTFSYTISTTAITVTQTGLETGLIDYVCVQ